MFQEISSKFNSISVGITGMKAYCFQVKLKYTADVFHGISRNF